MDNTNGQLKKGAILSYVNLALSSLIPLLYTPIMLRMLGEAEYGLYSLSGAAVGYLSLLSFGFGSTILRYLSLYRAKGEVENERKAFGFFLLVYTIVAVLVMAGGVILSNNIEGIFHRGLTPDELLKMKKLVLIMAFSTAITFPVSVFSSVVMAHERYVFRKLIEMLSTILAPVANLIALYLGYSSVGMAVAGVITHTLMLPIYACYCFSVLKIHPIFTVMPWRIVSEMLRFTGFVFLATIVDMLFWSTDKLLLGAMTSSIAVAVYNIGGTFNGMVMSVSSAMMNILSPRVTAMVACEEETERFTSLFIRIGRLQYVFVALLVSGFTVFGQTFIRLWAGEAYKDSYWIAILTMFPLCIPLIQNTGVSIVTAMNKHAFRSVVYLVIAIANVISTALIIPYMGGIGAALCSAISYLLGQGLIMNLFYWKKVGIDIPRFWKNILSMSGVPAVMLAGGLLLQKYISLTSWLGFFCGVILYTVAYCVGMYAFAMDSYEKSILLGAVNQIRKRLKGKP